MTRSRLGLFCVPLLGVSAWPGVAPGEEPSPPPAACPCASRPVPGVACWARPSDTGHYVGYDVGGGCVWHGDGPAPDQGTWGWDYGGLLLHPRIRLLWCRCGWRGYVPAYRTLGTDKGHSPSSP
ncbi:MAG TPA: hypothetical protein VKA46_12885 [Gemmataceae bacterium]|nr:hypothetical protein [Gemmataceae bacterium]